MKAWERELVSIDDTILSSEILRCSTILDEIGINTKIKYEGETYTVIEVFPNGVLTVSSKGWKEFFNRGAIVSAIVGESNEIKVIPKKR